MPKPDRIPSYRFHKASGQAVVVLEGRSFYLGPWDSPGSRAEYDRIIAEFLARRLRAPANPGKIADLSLDELILRYWKFAEDHYRRDGRPTRELDNIRDALRHIRRLYGHTQAREFGPLAFKAVRRAMVDGGQARNTVNGRLGKVRRMFKWAASEELLPASVHQDLTAVAGLRAGRDGVKETKPVRPVPEELIEAVLPLVTPPVAAMIRVQDLTGMRPGEVMRMRGGDLDRSGDVWVYRPRRHKMQDKGRGRAIPIGPKAQEVIRPWLKAAPDAFLFSPIEALALRNAERRRDRRSPVTPSEAKRKPKSGARRRPRGHYDKESYLNAIKRACDRAFPHPTLSQVSAEDLTDDQRSELRAWRRRNRWQPNQLRHGVATRVRRSFDLETAQVVLGHARADVTQVYAERDLGKAVEVMRQIG